MGLLDDAIREHLELKRLKGADPGEVARAEQDALGPVRRGKGRVRDEQGDGQADVPSDADGSFFSGSGLISAVDSSTSSYSGQETVEINMEAELDGGIDVEREREVPSDSCAASIEHPAGTQVDLEESLKWEMSSHRPNECEEVEAPKNDAHSRPDSDSDASEHVEDVLEETPDFLRDTPEHERLWFEQRPPRDFDFNE